MVELSKLQLSAVVLLTTLIAGLSTGAITANQDNTFFCADKNTVMECSEGLSSTGKTCYYNDAAGIKKGKVCYASWVKLKEVAPELNSLEVQPTLASVNPKLNCVVSDNKCFEGGFLDKRVDCLRCE